MSDMRDKYDIVKSIAPDGYVYCKIKRGMYGLKQAARFAYDALVKKPEKHRYPPDKYSPNIWVHDTRNTNFFLCVDNFGVKYNSKDDAQHSINALKHDYDITVGRD